MKNKQSKRLVIDASIAQAAGTTEHPTSKLSRECLSAVLQICHKIVMTPAIFQEWNKHQSLFAKKWLRCMIAKKKMVTGVDLTENEKKQIRENIEEFDTSSNKVKAMLKDVHLLEAALATDCVVVSSDEKVRHLFSDLSQQLVSVKRVAWVNPINSLEMTIDWLENGANIESPRQTIGACRQKLKIRRIIGRDWLGSIQLQRGYDKKIKLYEMVGFNPYNCENFILILLIFQLII